MGQQAPKHPLLLAPRRRARAPKRRFYQCRLPRDEQLPLNPRPARRPLLLTRCRRRCRCRLALRRQQRRRPRQRRRHLVARHFDVAGIQPPRPLPPAAHNTPQRAPCSTACAATFREASAPTPTPSRHTTRTAHTPPRRAIRTCLRCVAAPGAERRVCVPIHHHRRNPCDRRPAPRTRRALLLLLLLERRHGARPLLQRTLLGRCRRHRDFADARRQRGVRGMLLLLCSCRRRFWCGAVRWRLLLLLGRCLLRGLLRCILHEPGVLHRLLRGDALCGVPPATANHHVVG